MSNVKIMDSVGKFIPKTNKRYSITEDGVVFSHFKYANNGNKILRKTEVKYCQNLAKDKTTICVNLQFGKYSSTNRMKKLFVCSLMEKMFLLNAPDKHHYYDLRPIDGNYQNLSLSNLEYKIRTEFSSTYKFYPQPFYNKYGKITHKICGICGVKKEIKRFHLQNPKQQWHHRTYRNMCESCRGKKQLAYIKADIKRLLKYNKIKKEWSQSDIGIKYYKSYRKKYEKFHKENITPQYVKRLLKIGAKDVTSELISLYKKYIFLHRTIKKQKNEKPKQNQKGKSKSKSNCIKTKKVG